MKIPKVLKILGYTYTVKEVEPEDDFINEAVGRIDRWKNRIVIKKTLSSAMKESALLHEILHAIDVNGRLTEVQIEDLAEGLYQVLKDNKLYF